MDTTNATYYDKSAEELIDLIREKAHLFFEKPEAKADIEKTVNRITSECANRSISKKSAADDAFRIGYALGIVMSRFHD